MHATPITASHLPMSSPWARAFTLIKGFTDGALQHEHSRPIPTGDGRAPAFTADPAPAGFSSPATDIDDGADYRLRCPEVVRFAEPQGHRFTCLAGALWLTIDHEAKGLVLEAGETYQCIDRSAVMVSALLEARFSVRPVA
jgi:hypothetical protein